MKPLVKRPVSNVLTDFNPKIRESTNFPTSNLLSYFFVKKISLSRRVKYVVDGSMDQ